MRLWVRLGSPIGKPAGVDQPGIFEADDAEGGPRDIETDPEVQELYLGGDVYYGHSHALQDVDLTLESGVFTVSAATAWPYLREALRLIGIANVRFVLIGPTAGPAEPVCPAREAAHRRLAGSF